MASTYTTNLKIQEIASGEQSGYWGTTTNTNWTLIEQAVAGVVTIDMANADYTLTNLNGVSDEARNMVIKATGTNSGIRKIVAPLNQTKIYIISNETTGGYDITIGASTGAYITIPNGVTAQVYTDGTNFYSSQTGSAGDFYVNGNATVEGTLTVNGASNIVPAGTINMWPTASAPSGYLLCAGAAVSRSTYAALFDVIGTTFGAGDGSTTFNLPNYTNRMPYGTTIGATGGSADAIVVAHTHTGTTGGQSNDHTHYVSGNTGFMDRNNPHSHGYPGRLYGGGGNPGGDLNGLDNYGYRTYAEDINHLHFFAATSEGTSANHSHSFTTASSGSSGTNANLPPYLGINFIIKI